jgi:glycosyltransferase involved in cell wall biosynthesis
MKNKRNKPLNVLHVYIGLNMGGMQEFTLNLFKNIDKTKFNPIACVIENSGIIGKGIESLGLEVIVLGFKRQPIKTTLALIKIIKEKKIDIINGASYHLGLYARIAGSLSEVPVVISHEHGLYNKKRLHRVILNRLLSKFTDQFIAVSDAMAHQLLNWYHYPKNKVSTIHNGVDTARFAPATSKTRAKSLLGLDPERLVIGMICRLDPDKGHRFFFEAIKTLHKKYNVQWLVVGHAGGNHSHYEKEIKEYAEKLGLSQFVKFLGYRRDIPQLLAAFDIYVLPTLREGGPPISALEAMSTSCPVILSDYSCNLEAVENNVNGFIVPMQNSTALKNKIELLINDQNLRKKLGQSARKKVLENFSLKNNISKIERLYEELWLKKNNGIKSL